MAGFGLICAALPLRSFAARAASLALLLFGAGIALVQWETARASGPILEGEIGPRMVIGIIRAVEPRDDGVRLVFDDPVFDRLAPDQTPRRVRITVRTHGGIPPVPGQRVQILAILDTPPPPAYPGGFDFAREAFFDRIGGVGFAVGPLQEAEGGMVEVPSWFDLARLHVERIWLDATERILSALEEPVGGIAAALLTGHRSAVPAEELETIRLAGLAHLLAISGLHLGLVTAILFFVFRAFLAGFESVALRFPIKTWAAMAALVGAFGYLLISGATVPTQRAFLMTAIVLLAVALGRQAISLRLVALAAIAVMVLSPHVVTGASFQLSFAAVIALVAVYEALRDRWPRWRVTQGPSSRLVLYVAGVALTSLIANLATAPLVLTQFGRFATYGLLTNLIAVPVTAFWVMPWGLLSLVLMPLGLESLALVPMGWGIAIILDVAQAAADAPYAQIHTAASPAWVPAVFGLGLVWFCVWRTPVEVAWIRADAPRSRGNLCSASCRYPDPRRCRSGRHAHRGRRGRLFLSSSGPVSARELACGHGRTSGRCLAVTGFRLGGEHAALRQFGLSLPPARRVWCDGGDRRRRRCAQRRLLERRSHHQPRSCAARLSCGVGCHRPFRPLAIWHPCPVVRNRRCARPDRPRGAWYSPMVAWRGRGLIAQKKRRPIETGRRVFVSRMDWQIFVSSCE
jgi:competence protein ComEC